MEIVKAEVEAREASEGVKINPQRNQNTGFNQRSHASHHTASSLYAGSKRVQCAFCNEEHFSASCQKVTRVSKRKEILLKYDRCFTCLKPNHKLRECNSTKTCRHCHRKHHQSICETLADNSGGTTNTTSESDSSEQVTTTGSSVTGPANNFKGKGY